MDAATESASGDAYDVVHLAPAEWGNEVMRAVAEEWFAARPGCGFVLVHEHGGWALGYRRDGSIWVSANDGAVIRGTCPARYSGVEERRA